MRLVLLLLAFPLLLAFIAGLIAVSVVLDVVPKPSRGAVVRKY